MNDNMLILYFFTEIYNINKNSNFNFVRIQPYVIVMNTNSEYFRVADQKLLPTIMQAKDYIIMKRELQSSDEIFILHKFVIHSCLLNLPFFP